MIKFIMREMQDNDIPVYTNFKDAQDSGDSYCVVIAPQDDLICDLYLVGNVYGMFGQFGFWEGDDMYSDTALVDEAVDFIIKGKSDPSILDFTPILD